MLTLWIRKGPLKLLKNAWFFRIITWHQMRDVAKDLTHSLLHPLCTICQLRAQQTPNRPSNTLKGTYLRTSRGMGKVVLWHKHNSHMARPLKKRGRWLLEIRDRDGVKNRSDFLNSFKKHRHPKLRNSTRMFWWKNDLLRLWKSTAKCLRVKPQIWIPFWPIWIEKSRNCVKNG